MKSPFDNYIDGAIALRCQFIDIIKKPNLYEGQFVRLIGRIEEYDAPLQTVTVSDPLLKTKEILIINTSKIEDLAIFKTDICSFFGKLKQANGCHILEAFFHKNCSSINVHQLLKVEKMVMDYTNKETKQPSSRENPFMDNEEKMILELF